MSLIKQGLSTTAPKQEPATAAIYAYQAKDAAEYQALLFTDPRSWWHEAKPRTKARFKNVKLTNAISRGK
jgi:hypothetical protein